MSDIVPPYKKPEVWIAAINASIVAILSAAVMTPENPDPTHVHIPAWLYVVLDVLAAGLQVFAVHYGTKLREAGKITPGEPVLTPDTFAINTLANLRDIDPQLTVKAAHALAPQDQIRLGTLARMLLDAVATSAYGGHDPPRSAGGTP